MLYDNAQAFARRVVSVWQLPIDWLNIPTGGVALDVGSGPGNVTASLARAAGPDGLALGVDISEPMLARAVDARGRAPRSVSCAPTRSSCRCATRPSTRSPPWPCCS